MRPTVKILNNIVAQAADGPVVKYNIPSTQNAGMFSKSFRCALRILSMIGSSYFTLPFAAFASSGFANTPRIVRIIPVNGDINNSFKANIAVYAI